MLGLITGSGFYDLPQLLHRRTAVVETPYGSTTMTFGTWEGAHEVVFLARHGTDHSVAPHLINYRANIAALRQVGVTAILATAVSGGIRDAFVPGTLVIIDDFLDFTSGRPGTFFDEAGSVRHTEMGTAYDPELRGLINEAARAAGIATERSGTYCTFNGPRFETPAEIRMAALVGGDLVGMTGYPEVVLARELGMAYASIGVISNRAAGLGAEELSMEEIMAVLAEASGPLHRLIGATIERFHHARTEAEYANSRMFSVEDVEVWGVSAKEDT